VHFPVSELYRMPRAGTMCNWRRDHAQADMNSTILARVLGPGRSNVARITGTVERLDDAERAAENVWEPAACGRRFYRTAL